MRTDYFDLTDGVPTRDRKGIEFASAAGAIEHGKELARRLRDDPRVQDPGLAIVIVDESGAEIHRELVNPDTPNPAIPFTGTRSINKVGR
jgi:hypothetical protein